MSLLPDVKEGFDQNQIKEILSGSDEDQIIPEIYRNLNTIRGIAYKNRSHNPAWTRVIRLLKVHKLLLDSIFDLDTDAVDISDVMSAASLSD
jgi:hypothetical protein